MDNSKYIHLTTSISIADSSLISIGNSKFPNATDEFKWNYGLTVWINKSKRSFANRIITQYLNKVMILNEENIDTITREMYSSYDSISKVKVGKFFVDSTNINIFFKK